MAEKKARIILIPVDESEYSDKSFEYALAAEEWKRLVIEHEARIKALEDKYKSLCEAAKISAKIRIDGGSPGETICKNAKEENVDLVVMGSRGLGTIRRTILGSVSDYVLHHAHCPTVIVPREHKH